MKLSDYKGEDAIDVLADIIEPAGLIISDEQFKTLAQKKVGNLAIVKFILKEHKHEIVEILAALERKTYDEYVGTVTLLTLPVKVIELLNDEELTDFFEQQVQMMDEDASGLATENIGEEA